MPKNTAPKASANPRYYSTGAKLDIRTSDKVPRFNDGLTYKERGEMWARNAAKKKAMGY